MRYFAAARDCGVFVTADRVTKLGQVFRYLQYLQIISILYTEYHNMYNPCVITSLRLHSIAFVPHNKRLEIY